MYKGSKSGTRNRERLSKREYLKLKQKSTNNDENNKSEEFAVDDKLYFILFLEIEIIFSNIPLNGDI
jgi:hypothetical protein